MKAKCHQLLLTFSALLLLSCNQISAQTQISSSASNAKPEGVQHHVRLQLLVASNIITAKTDYPSALEAVVGQLKTSLPFKSYYLNATYLYEVADDSDLKVNDATYKPLENGGGLELTLLNLTIENIKLNPSGDSIHMSKFKFEVTRTMFTGMTRDEGSNAAREVFRMVPTGVDTEVSVREGVPTLVGTTSSGLSDGVLAIIVTVGRSGAR